MGTRFTVRLKQSQEEKVRRLAEEIGGTSVDAIRKCIDDFGTDGVAESRVEGELSALKDEVSAHQRVMKHMLDTLFAVIVGPDWRHLMDDHLQAQRNLEAEEEIRQRWGVYRRERAVKTARRALAPIKQEDGTYKPPDDAYEVARKITGRA